MSTGTDPMGDLKRLLFVVGLGKTGTSLAALTLQHFGFRVLPQQSPNDPAPSCYSGKGKYRGCEDYLAVKVYHRLSIKPDERRALDVLKELCLDVEGLRAVKSPRLFEHWRWLVKHCESEGVAPSFLFVTRDMLSRFIRNRDMKEPGRSQSLVGELRDSRSVERAYAETLLRLGPTRVARTSYEMLAADPSRAVLTCLVQLSLPVVRFRRSIPGFNPSMMTPAPGEVTLDLLARILHPEMA